MNEIHNKNRKTIEVAKTTTLVAIKTTTRIERIAELTETAPSCNDCVATIVARPFTTTVKGINQPSGVEIRLLFPRIQESGGVSGLELKPFYTNF